MAIYVLGDFYPVRPPQASTTSEDANLAELRRSRASGDLSVSTDSGAVQTECAIDRVPTVLSTTLPERPETIERGSNIPSGSTWAGSCNPSPLLLRRRGYWSPASECSVPNEAQVVGAITLET